MTNRRYLAACLPALFAGLLVSSDPAKALDTDPVAVSTKPRLIVLTDMSSIQSGVREPDDAQSLIRLMLYANEFDIEGLVASSGLQHGRVVRPEYIRRIVDAYAQCRPNLVVHNKSYPDFYNKSYPTADQLRRVIKSGQPHADRGIPASQSIGAQKDTQASEWIINVVDKSDSRPVWVTVWGGPADLAQALWKVRNTRSSAQVAEFVSRLRVVASGNQDETAGWIKNNFPNIFFATRKEGARGMYRGGDQSLVSSSWVKTNIRGHGALGQMYPDYHGGDIWSWKIGKINGIKGGDSATYMGLIRNGLNVPDKLSVQNWGGRLQIDGRNPDRYWDDINRVGNYRKDISPYLAAVYRWRPDFQADYAARFDWCAKPYSQANHNPMNSTGNQVINTRVASGKRIRLQSGNWSDPDGNNMAFHWQKLSEESSYRSGIKIENGNTESPYITAPNVSRSQSISMLLTVKDDGKPPLVSYKRVNLTVSPR